MKAIFLHLAAWAAPAFAAPARVAHQMDGVSSTVANVNIEHLASTLDLVKALHEMSTPAINHTTGSSRDVIQLLEGLVGGVKGQTGAINGTLAKVHHGTMSKDDAAVDVSSKLLDIHLGLTDIFGKLRGYSDLKVPDEDVDKVRHLVVVLIHELVFTVGSLVTVLDPRPQLISLLLSLFNVVAGLLRVLVDRIAGLLPGLVDALSLLVDDFGNGLLVPLPAPVVDLLAGLS